MKRLYRQTFHRRVWFSSPYVCKSSLCASRHVWTSHPDAHMELVCACLSASVRVASRRGAVMSVGCPPTSACLPIWYVLHAPYQMGTEMQQCLAAPTGVIQQQMQRRVYHMERWSTATRPAWRLHAGCARSAEEHWPPSTREVRHERLHGTGQTAQVDPQVGGQADLHDAQVCQGAPASSAWKG
jgi:hypothetical protein